MLNDEEIGKILKLDDFTNVKEKLKKYLKQKYSDSYIELLNQLLIYYVEKKYKESNEKNYFEKILYEHSEFNDYYEKLDEYLISQKIDLNYKTISYYGIPSVLVEYLGLNINSRNTMQKFLNKDIKGLYIYNYYLGKHTDLCRLNIYASNINKAIDIFNNKNYQLLFRQDIDNAYEKLIKFREVYLDGLNGINDDILYQILVLLNNNNSICDAEKIKFLNNILYSDKIKIINKLNFKLIQNILLEKDYEKYLSYLNNKKNIVIFSFKYNQNVLYYESLNEIRNRNKCMVKY